MYEKGEKDFLKKKKRFYFFHFRISPESFVKKNATII